MVDEKDGVETATAEPTPKGALESAVQKVREQAQDKVAFKVLSEENLSGARRKLQVEVEQGEWERRLEELFKNVRSQATLPGFRKGKAPLHMLKKRYREGAVNELVEKVSPMIIRDYETDKELVVYGTPTITAYEAEDGKAPTITYEMEIKPEITAENYKGLSVESAEHEMDPEAVSTRLDELREQAAVYDEVERGWQDGDAVVIDYKITGEKGKTLSHRSNQFIENPAMNLPAEVVELLKDKKAEESFDATSNNINYSVTVKSVKEKKLPELNDDFAKDLGYENEADMRAKVQEEIEKLVATQRDDEAFEALTLKLVESHEFDIPDALKQHVQKEMAETDMNYLRSTGYRPPRLMNIEEPEEYSKVLEQDAIQRVKGFLLIDAIGKKENIEVTEEDINAALEVEAAQAGRKPVAVRAALERNKQWARFLEQVRFEKIRDFLLKQNNITYVKKEEKAEDEAAEAAPAEEKKKTTKKKAKAEEAKPEAEAKSDE